MNTKIKESIKKAGRLAEARGLTAYEGQTIYIRYMARENVTLDDARAVKIYDGLLDIYKSMNCRWLLHEPELFELETDRG
jgi:hypothetical protein